MGKLIARLEVALSYQRGHLFIWAPVFLGLGIALYFSLRSEPDFTWQMTGGAVFVTMATWWARDRSGLRAIPMALCLMAAGFFLAQARANLVAAPRLDMAYYGAVEGRVVAIDRSSSDALRITLDQVSLYELGPRRPPDRVRVSLHGKAEGFTPEALSRIKMRARLSPPAGPVEPYGFDFQRHAWFLGLGGLGYTRAPPQVVAPAPTGFSIAKLRQTMSGRIQAHLEGDIGGIAAAITTGDRSGLLKSTSEALRATNLAHLLAISGLHMGLLVGVVFSGLRYGAAVFMPLTVHINSKKLAAWGALLAAALYLALSGGAIATERAFVMAAVALVAVLLDKRAISIRSVAIAALIVLSLRPETLLSPGFQMSFSATTALVWVYERLRMPMHWPKSVNAVGSVVVTSFVAGAATAPFAAAHFNGYASYGLFANIMAVPVMGMVVMPAAVVAFLLSPFGLEGLGLTVMGWGLEWILGVAELFAGLDGALRLVASPPPMVLALLTLGAVIFMFWKEWGRAIGVVPVCVAGWMWLTVDRPTILVDESGKLVGVMTEAGRALSKSRGQGFPARAWLENDADGADQAEAFARMQGREMFTFGAHRVWIASGKRIPEAALGCQEGDILVSAKPVDQAVNCKVYDPTVLKTLGSLSIEPLEAGFETLSVRQRRGQRLWSPPAQMDQ